MRCYNCNGFLIKTDDNNIKCKFCEEEIDYKKAVSFNLEVEKNEDTGSLAYKEGKTEEDCPVFEENKHSKTHWLSGYNTRKWMDEQKKGLKCIEETCEMHKIISSSCYTLICVYYHSGKRILWNKERREMKRLIDASESLMDKNKE